MALGSNLARRTASGALADRLDHLHHALEALRVHPLLRMRRVSRIIETEPIGPPGQRRYLNACCLVETTLGARALLDLLLSVEVGAGRVRAGERWGPRTLDLDLLVFGDEVIDEPGLIVPHPELHTRGFVLEPLALIASGMMVPGRGRVADLLRALEAGDSLAP
ncbi:MAG: 2-amino-4-hydroxy-6-hydroxymethyldihydropteridine diphosphokinase [Planctomycetota bacterium]